VRCGEYSGVLARAAAACGGRGQAIDDARVETGGGSVRREGSQGCGGLSLCDESACDNDDDGFGAGEHCDEFNVVGTKPI
jgi:hypothetical protein